MKSTCSHLKIQNLSFKKKIKTKEKMVDIFFLQKTKARTHFTKFINDAFIKY
jgi:hypothetical protein